MIYSVDQLQNLGIMDPLFPYPLAFCSFFNIAILIINIVLFIAIFAFTISVVKWIYKLF